MLEAGLVEFDDIGMVQMNHGFQLRIDLGSSKQKLRTVVLPS